MTDEEIKKPAAASEVESVTAPEEWFDYGDCYDCGGFDCIECGECHECEGPCEEVE